MGVTPITSFDAFELKPGASYKFRVTARNRFGWGEPTVTREPIIAGCQHLRPEIITDLPGQLKALQSTNLTLQCEVKQISSLIEDNHFVSYCSAPVE